MRKNEFMDLLQYYFRKSDKNDLKGIIEDCEEQFRLGASQGKTEEEICCKLGHPKNIYRYYIGEPIVPEDNPRLPGDDYDDSYQEYDDFGPGTVSSRYDLPEQPDDYGRPRKTRRSYQSRPPQRRSYQEPDRETGRDFNWNDGANNTAKAVASPFLDILGTLFGILSGFLYAGLTLVILASIAISFIPTYAYSDLLPLPTISIMTRVLVVLTVLFASLTASYAGQACHAAARGRRS